MTRYLLAGHPAHVPQKAASAAWANRCASMYLASASAFNPEAAVRSGIATRRRIAQSPRRWHQAAPFALRTSSSMAAMISISGDTAGPSAVVMARDPLGLARIDCAALLLGSPPGDVGTVTKRCFFGNKTISRQSKPYGIDSRLCSIVRGIIFIKENRSGIAVP